MFPIQFPLSHLSGCDRGSWILDPFCGRGTTLLAARMLGLNAVGIDSNPVAVAISKAKLAAPSPASIVALARKLLTQTVPDPRPLGDFWDWAFHRETLGQILALRAGLRNRDGPVAAALRGIVLGALHGPRPKHKLSYFSNQMQRTFAPKPGYATRFWRERSLEPPNADVLAIVAERAHRYFGGAFPPTRASVRVGDARELRSRHVRIARTVTSPPYFGMDTYVPDQWLRNWFLDGEPFPTYRHPGQISIGNAATFAAELSKVWRRVAAVTVPGGHLVIRFGALASRPCDPAALIDISLTYPASPWKVLSVRPAGDASAGRRQTAQMGPQLKASAAVKEIDVVCRLG